MVGVNTTLCNKVKGVYGIHKRHKLLTPICKQKCELRVEVDSFTSVDQNIWVLCSVPNHRKISVYEIPLVNKIVGTFQSTKNRQALALFELVAL
jgi:hypothetical protein